MEPQVLTRSRFCRWVPRKPPPSKGHHGFLVCPSEPNHRAPKTQQLLGKNDGPTGLCLSPAEGTRHFQSVVSKERTANPEKHAVMIGSLLNQGKIDHVLKEIWKQSNMSGVLDRKHPRQARRTRRVAQCAKLEIWFTINEVVQQ